MTPRPWIIDNSCAFISVWVSLFWGVFCCGQTPLIVCSTNLQLLQYSTLFLWGVSGSHHSIVFCLSFWTVNTPKSKCNLAQPYNADEPHNEIDSGVLESQVWFHIVLTSAGALLTDVRDEKLINFYCDICRRGKCGNRKAEKRKKFGLLLLPGLLSLSELHWYFCWFYRQLGILLGGGAPSLLGVHACASVCVCIDRWLSIVWELVCTLL